MNTPRPFQIAVIGGFATLVILGFLAFSGKLPLPVSKSDINYGQVTMWGTIPQDTMQTLISAVLNNAKNISIKYVEKSDATLTRDFVEALADGKGPDLVLLPQDEIVTNLNKFNVIPYQTYSERDFKNTFIQEAEMFLRPTGVLALPFTVDPMVMYWNRDIFTSALVAKPPAYWSDFYNLVPKITTRDPNGVITRSLVSFGGYRNVTNAKEIILTLMMQAGSPVVQNQNGIFSPMLLPASDGATENPVITALRFYTEFSKPEKDSYSWNSSLPEARSMFEAGDLALYFGYASEYQTIQQKNPHLNFDVVMMPQVSSAATKVTFGKIQGIAVVAASKNQAGAFYAASLLSSADAEKAASNLFGLPPVRRDLIATARPSDAALSTFYDSALISKAWFDPSPADTDSLFMTMLDNITSGRSTMTEALLFANNSLAELLSAH